MGLFGMCKCTQCSFDGSPANTDVMSKKKQTWESMGGGGISGTILPKKKNLHGVNFESMNYEAIDKGLC